MPGSADPPTIAVETIADFIPAIGMGAGRSAARDAVAAPHPSPTLATYLSYGVGMTGNQILRDVPTALLLFYMTNALFIPAAYAGFAILLPKVWVIVADPMVGAMSDRTRGRWGPRKPFLFVGSLASTATFILLFNVPSPPSPLMATILIGCLYVLLSTAYSVYSVPYLTLASELGDEPKERTTALAYKQFFCLVGVMAGLALAPWLIKTYGGGRPAYGAMSWYIGAILLVTTMASALLTPTRHPLKTHTAPTGNLLRQVVESFSHRPFRIVFLASTLQLLGFGVNQGGGLYFLIYIMHMPITVLGESIVVAVVGAAVSQPLWVKMSVRWGTIPTYIIASFWSGVTAIAVLAIPPGDVAAYIILSFFGGTASCGFTLMSFAALIEAIALDGPDSNRRGLFAAAYTAMEKAMLALGGFVVAGALAASHFVQGAPLSAQPATVVPGIVFTYIWFPVALKLLSVVILMRFSPKPHSKAVAA
jgi:GPH family glycoside/pentoside/hexuronide:cation symporter